MDDAVREANIELQSENKSLNLLVTSLHEQHHTMKLRYAEMKDKLSALEEANDDLKNRIDDVEFELNRTRCREQRLEDHLHEAREKLRNLQTASPNENDNGEFIIKKQLGNFFEIFSTNIFLTGHKRSPTDSVSQAKVEELHKDLEEQRDLSAARLQELEQLNNDHKETLKLIEKLKMDLQCIPEAVIVETAEYKCLQSHFSVLYNESLQLKTQLEVCFVFRGIIHIC